EDISTIFISGFPDDVQERELRNMFIFAPGFQAASLKLSTGGDSVRSLVAFAKFRTFNEASYARDYLNGRTFDSDRGLILNATLATRNLQISHRQDYIPQPSHSVFKSTSPNFLDSVGHLASASSTSALDSAFLGSQQQGCIPWDILNETGDSAVKPVLPTNSILGFSSTTSRSLRINTTSCQLRLDTEVSSLFNENTDRNMTTCRNSPTGLDNEPLEILPVPIPNGGDSLIMPTAASIAAAGYRCPADQNPPCNTLYVGNLPLNTCEAELRELFSRCLGYRRMSFRMRVNGPMVFVEFDSVPYAQQALNDLHGTLLSNSIKGGIRLSFSKNPLGVRPTAQTQFGSTNGWGMPGSGLVSPVSGFYGGEMMV
ncbi:hypothetical protein BDR26DRAFT_806116, partial [Obelidium mucronatum]